MSQENLEIIKAGIEALNARDFQAIKPFFDDEVEWRPAVTGGGVVEGTVYRGLTGMAKYFEEVDSGFDDMGFEVAHVEDLGSGRALFRGRVTARGTRSGVPIDVPIWALWTIRNGKVVRGAAFLSEREALEAVSRSD